MTNTARTIAVYASTMEATIARINAEKLDWLPHPGNAELYLRADADGIWMVRQSDDQRINRQADSWLATHRAVSLVKAEAPECVAVQHPVETESNAVVMARAVAAVRDRRLMAEYVAAKDGYTGSGDTDEAPEWVGLATTPDAENARALAAEQARADAARKLASGTCTHCEFDLKPGQTGVCDDCHECGHGDDDDDSSGEFINHYRCQCDPEPWTEYHASADAAGECSTCRTGGHAPFKSEDA